MKNLFIFLCCIFLLSGCSINTSSLSMDLPNDSLSGTKDSSESWLSSNSSSISVPGDSSLSQFVISGKYICSSEGFDDEFFIRYPELIPYVSFYDDGSCDFLINYLEGNCIITGFYSIKENQIHAIFDLRNTVFQSANERFMDNYFIFRIITDDYITIDKMAYAVEPGDPFIRTE